MLAKRSGKVGFVTGIETREGRTLLTLVLNYQELRQTPLLLGEFLYLKSGSYYKDNPQEFLVWVTDAFYKPVAYDDHARALALGHLNQDDLDENAVRQMNFLHYQVAILGCLRRPNGGIEFFPSTRLVPSLVDVSLEFISQDDLKKLINLSTVEQEPVGARAALGFLQYGSSPDHALPLVKKYVDVSCFRGRRTANFGKTGLGKSNENKSILALVKHSFRNTSALIFDLNGEYALQKSTTTAYGLIEAFQKLHIKGQVVWYTNRIVEDLPSDYVALKRPRVDFFEFPELALELAYARAISMDGRSPLYLESVHLSMEDIMKVPNRVAFVYGALLEAGLPCPNKTITFASVQYTLPRDKDSLLAKLKESASKESTTKKGAGNAEGNGESEQGPTGGSTKDLFRYGKRLSFLSDYHQQGQDTDLFKGVLADLKAGKYVIVDLPSLRPEAIEFISVRMASKLFQEAQDSYALGRELDVLVVIEEAHNLLRDAKGIFYRLAKEGRKYGIGMLYSTQSPSGIDKEILSQTENFLVKHVSSEADVKHLANSKVVFGPPVSNFLLNEPVVGLSFVYMEPYQAFPVPVKVHLLDTIISELAAEQP